MNLPNSTSHFSHSGDPSSTEAEISAARHARMLEAILATSSDHVYLLDREGHCRYVGMAAANRLGIERDQILGRSLKELGLPDETVQVLDAHRKQTFASGEKLESSVSILFSDGSCDFEYQVIPFQGENGEAEAVILRLKDVTEHNRRRQDLEASEAKYRQLLDTANEGILAIDAEDVLIYVNARMAESWGMRKRV